MNKDCRHCKYRAFNIETGMTCTLTGEKPATSEGCESFEPDQAALEIEAQNAAAEASSEELAVEDSGKNDKMQPLDKRHLFLGIVTGIGVGLVAACLWALITALTDRQYGVMPILIGLAVGAVVRAMSKNDSIMMAVIASVIAVASCFLGDFLANIHYIAQEENLTYFETLQSIYWKYFFEIATLGFDPMTGLFYIFAIVEAFSLVRGKNKKKDQI